MAKILKSGKVTNFNPNKHPRGSHGRFTETPDAVKATTGRRSSAAKDGQVDPRSQPKGLRFARKSRKPPTQTEILKQSRVLRNTEDAARVYQARLEFVQGLNLEQRRRLQEVLRARKEAKGLQRSQTNSTGKYLAANPDHLSIKGDRLTIWDGKPELAKTQGGFKTRKVKGYEYSVEVDGKQVVLNRNTNMHEYMGDRIYGMPSLTPRLAAMTPVQLADGLAKYMTKVETKDSTVPDWLPTYHGKVDKGLVTKGYGINAATPYPSVG